MSTIDEIEREIAKVKLLNDMSDGMTAPRSTRVLELAAIELTAANERIRELEDFKSYTHQRLDEMGVPHSIPESEHDKAGCRVGGRFDWVEANLTAEREVSDKLEKALTGILGWIDDWCETSDGDFQTLELAADAALAEVAAIRKKDRE